MNNCRSQLSVKGGVLGAGQLIDSAYPVGATVRDQRIVGHVVREVGKPAVGHTRTRQLIRFSERTNEPLA